MKYKLGKNLYFGWHRGSRGIRADVLNNEGKTVAKLIGNQDFISTEYTVHNVDFSDVWPDEFVRQTTRRKGSVNSKCYYCRADVLGDLNGEAR